MRMRILHRPMPWPSPHAGILALRGNPDPRGNPNPRGSSGRHLFRTCISNIEKHDARRRSGAHGARGANPKPPRPPIVCGKRACSMGRRRFLPAHPIAWRRRACRAKRRRLSPMRLPIAGAIRHEASPFPSAFLLTHGQWMHGLCDKSRARSWGGSSYLGKRGAGQPPQVGTEGLGNHSELGKREG